MGSIAIDPSLFHNDDMIRMLDAGYPLRDDQFRSLRDLLREGLPNLRIGSRIHGTGTVI